MEIIKINCEKVKISLTCADMEHLQISCDMLGGSDKRSRQAFNKILDEAKDKCNFSTEGKRLFVQLFPSKDGGCDIFITGTNDCKEKKYTLNKKKKTVCYRFKDINNLILFCRTAKKQKYDDVSDLYIEEKSKSYYVCLQQDYPFAEEYYGLKCTANSDAYITEHFRLVAENAVSKLGDL